jgi:hypothetical protein
VDGLRLRDRRAGRGRGTGARRVAAPERAPAGGGAGGRVCVGARVGVRALERALRAALVARRLHALTARRCRDPRAAGLHLVRGGVERDRVLRPSRDGRLAVGASRGGRPVGDREGHAPAG